MSAAPKPGRWVVVICLAALALILYLRLIPFVFVWDGRMPIERIQWQPLMLLDFPFNILLFVPLGFGLAGLLARRGPALGCRVVLAGILLSTILEATQVFMPDRVPSLADIAANGVGALLGYGLFRAWEMGIGRALDRCVTRRNLLLGSALYALGVALLTAYFYRSAILDNWDTSFPLVVGNEATGERPWSGRVDYLDLETAFDGSPEYTARYRFTGEAPFEDIFGNPVPPLEWREGPLTGHDDQGVNVGPDEWLSTAGAFSGFSGAARRTDEFTVRVGVASSNPKQWGPARIVSISAGTDRRNITVGQEHDALIIRLRTPASGENGQKPEMLVPGVFVSSDWRNRNITVRYNAPLMMVWVDEQEYALSLAPGAAFFSSFITENRWQTSMIGNPHRYNWAYWGIVAGLGVLVFGGLTIARRLTAS